MKLSDIRRQDTLRRVKPLKRGHINCIRINAHSTLNHERAKFDHAVMLAKIGKNFITEAELENGSRCDLLVLEDQEAVEFQTKLDQKIIDTKKDLYFPLKVSIVNVNVDRNITFVEAIMNEMKKLVDENKRLRGKE